MSSLTKPQQSEYRGSTLPREASSDRSAGLRHHSDVLTDKFGTVNDSQTAEVLRMDAPCLQLLTLSASSVVGAESVRTDSAIQTRVSMNWMFVKRSFDFVGSVALLVLLSPVLLVLCALVACSGGGQPIFGHRRIGRGGREFTCYKFRTMVPNAEAVLQRVLDENPDMRAEWERDEKLRNDPRVTRVGDFLRRSSLDELPQLFNVLRGEMSLVGPRPATNMGLAYYGRAARWYLAVRPGMTGLWQVSGRNEVDFRRRVVLDTYYVRAQSLVLDLKILFRTIGVVLRGNGR